MYKFLGYVLVAGGLLVAAPAFAATISNPLFSTGQTTIDATGGSTVSGTFTLTVGPGEAVEWLRTQSDPSQPFADTSVGGQLGYQEQTYTNVPFTVKVPPNAGTTVYPTAQGAGIYGGNRSINGGDSVVVGPVTLGTVRVVASGTSSGSASTGGWEEAFAALSAKIADLTALIAKLGTVSKPAYCASIVAYNGTNAIAAQASLLGTPHASVFTAAGVYAPTGYWGPISMRAAAAASAACN